jgi:hypothetical protein
MPDLVHLNSRVNVHSLLPGSLNGDRIPLCSLLVLREDLVDVRGEVSNVLDVSVFRIGRSIAKAFSAA